MAGTISERIRAEQSARKLAREAIFADKVEPAPEEAGPPFDGEALLSRFTREVVPVLSRAVQSELAAGLEKVRGELVSCLERALGASPAGALPAIRRSDEPRKGEDLEPETKSIPAAAPLEEPRTDSSDTDLELSAEEVSRQLDQAFEELEPDRKSDASRVKARETAPERPSPAPPSLPEPSAPPPAQEAAADAAGLAQELKNALVLGIADGIAKFVDELEEGQERIVEELSALTRELTALRGREEERPGLRGGFREGASVAEAGGPVAGAEGARTWPGDAFHEFQDTVIRVLKEMEQRIMSHLELLAAPVAEDRHA